MKTYNLASNSLSIVFFLFLFNVSLKGQIIKNEWQKVELTNEMQSHLKSLQNPEQIEQCRDWIKYAVINIWGFDEKVQFDLLFDFNPLRYSFLEDLSDFEFGEYRYIIQGQEIIAIIPNESAYQQNYIARISDEYRLLKGSIPSKLHIINYSIEKDNYSSIKIRYTEEVNGRALFSSQYGYVETTVKNTSSLSDFISRTDDVCYLKKAKKGIVLGGRKYKNIPYKGITLEDIAVLYQADNNAKNQYLARLDKRGLYLEYLDEKLFIESQLSGESIQSNHASIKGRLEIMNDPVYSIFEKVDPELQKKLERNLKILEDVLNYGNYFESNKNYFVPDENEVNVGFSLDPTVRYRLLASKIIKIVNDPNYFEEWYVDEMYDSNRKLAIFSLKDSNEESASFEDQLASKDDAIENYFSVETSFSTFLNGENLDNSKDKEEITSIIQKAFEIKESDIKDQVDDYKKDLRSAINNNKEILLVIANWINDNEGGKDWEKMSLFYTLKSYFSNYLTFNFDKDYRSNSAFEEYEKIVYDRIIKDVSELLVLLDFSTTKSTSFDDNLIAAINKFREEKELPINGKIDTELFENLLEHNSWLTIGKRSELGELNSFLFSLRAIYSYQKGRYDGDLQGTEVGMTLYYTDLIMKLWSFDYEQSSPKSVDGFFSKTNFKISPVHQKASEINSSTRSWLSFIDHGVEYHGAGESIFFSHVATKIYNASSNDLDPGKEVQANYSSKRFAKWWNSNYSKVADYEPEFHRLNQIQKWSHITHWLKEVNRLEWLDNTSFVKNRNIDFEDWYNSNSSLIVRAKIDFLNKTILRENTECIEIIQSDPYLPYLNDFSIYHFSGGVSLSKRGDAIKKMTQPKPSRLKNGNIDRPNIEFRENTFTPGKFTKTDGKTINISPKDRTVKISKSKQQNFLGNKSKVYRISVDRNIGANGRIKQSSNNISLGEINIKRVGNKEIKLSIKESEIHNAKKIMTEISESFNYKKINSDAIFSNNKLAEAYRLGVKDEYLVRMKGSENFLILRKEKIPFGRRDAFNNPLTDIRIRLNQKNYLDGQIVSPREAKTLKGEFEYMKINSSWWKIGDIELTSKVAKSGEPIFFKQGNKTVEVIKTEDGWLIKTNPNENNLSILNTIRNSDNFLRTQGNNANGVIFNADNSLTYFGKNPIKGNEVTKVQEVTKGFKKEVDAVIFNTEGKIKFVDNNIITLPRSMSTTDVKTVKLMQDKIVQNKAYKKLWQDNQVNAKDINEITKIKNDNFSIAESYYHFKKTNNLKDGNGLIDFTSYSKQLQYVVKESNSELPRIVTINKLNKNSIVELGTDIQKITSEGGKQSKQLFEQKGRELFNHLETIAQQTNSKTLIIRGEKANSQKIYSYFGGKNTKNVKFIRDEESDVARSVENIGTIIIQDFSSSIFLSTFDLKGELPTDVKRPLSEILNTQIKTQDQLDSKQFFSILTDSISQQIYLLVRGNEKGLIFSDKLVNYEVIEKVLTDRTVANQKKDFIYVISNEGEKIEKVFAKSKWFNFIFTSQYKLNDVTSLNFALEGAKEMTKAFNQDVFSIKNRKLKKILKKNPNIESTLMKYAEKNGGKTAFNFGKMPRALIKKLPVSFLDKIFGKNKVYKPKNTLDLFENIQDGQLQNLKNGKVPFEHKLPAVPQLKAYHIYGENIYKWVA